MDTTQSLTALSIAEPVEDSVAGTRLSRALARYYAPRTASQPYVFRNGMNLSQLSAAAAEILQARGFAPVGVDEASLSRALSGKRGRYLRGQALNAVGEALGLSYDERADLQRAAVADADPDIPRVVDLWLSSSAIDQLDARVRALEGIRTGGNPALVLRISEQLLSDLAQYLERGRTESVRLKLIALWGHVHMEWYRAITEQVRPGESVPIASWRAARIREAAQACGNSELAALSEFVVGSGHYLSGEHGFALPAFRRAMGPDLNIVDQVWTLRAAMIDAAHLGLPRDQLRYEQELIRLVDSGLVPPAEVLCVYEGIGRARGRAGLPGAAKAFQTEREMLETMQRRGEQAPFRFVQLAYGELEVANRVPELDRTHLETVGKEALVIARMNGYDRHARRLEARLDRIG